MPGAEVDVSSRLVSDLLESQRPDLAGLAVVPIGFGWDNFSFLVGDDLVARLPRREAAVRLVENEVRWLPEIASRLPLPVPTPVFLGEPGPGYPWRWTLVPWIPGDRVSREVALETRSGAIDLGTFLRALHEPAPAEAPQNPFRGIPLMERDGATRERIGALTMYLDPATVLSVWEAALEVQGHDGQAVWIHGDLHPANLLSVDGRLSGVIDFGDLASGDPATDLAVAWMLFGREDREVFRQEYGGVTRSTWDRARGWALSLAVAILANSADNAEMEAIGRVTLERVLADVGPSPTS